MQQFLTELARLSLTVVLTGLIGFERQIHGRWAGLRTHIGVGLGTCVFMLAGLGIAPPTGPEATRVIQGIAAGVGFLGAGTILKLRDQLEVKGLTTASSIWLAAAVGTACGIGMFSLAISSTILTLLVLAVLRPLEKHFPTRID
jgi:putative Mg2+ transporter-C (MgtC) family protein